MKIKIDHDHKCKCVSRAPNMGPERDWWIGELTEMIKEYPEETHCLHLKSPVKEVVYLCNIGDFEQLQVICEVVTGKLNRNWVDKMKNMSTKNI